jgi:hypothetical protein
MAAAAPHISKDIDRKIHELARNFYQDGKKRNAETLPELKTMVSGTLDDGTPHSLIVKIRPNPINPRLAAGWKVIAQDKHWEIDPDEMEKSRLLS